MTFSKSNLCRSEGVCAPQRQCGERLLAVIETLRFAQGDKFRFCQPTLRKPYIFCRPLAQAATHLSP